MAKIAVIDDMPVNRELLTTLLQALGHVSLEAANGAEALELVRKERPDLIFCDILMPVMDGYEFVRRLREEPDVAHIPVVFFTAYYLEMEAQQLANACGVAAILPKPYDPDNIVQLLEKLLGPAAVQTEAAPEAPAVLPEDFDREHLRLMTDKLSEKVDELQASNRKLGALIDLNLNLASQRSTSLLLEAVCNGARNLIGANYASIAVHGTEHEGVAFYSHSGFEPDQLAALGKCRLDRGWLKAVVDERAPLRRVLRPSQAGDVGLPTGYPAAEFVLAAPIASITAAYGWICLVNKQDGHAFTEDDEHLLGIIAAQAGRIYETGSLYARIDRHAKALEREIVDRERVQQQLSAQYKVARILGEAETLEEATERLLASVCKDLGFSAAGLWEVEECNQALSCIGAWCEPGEDCVDFVEKMRQTILTKDDTLIGRTWASRKTTWIEDLRETPGFAQCDQAEKLGLRAAVAVPVCVRGHIVGVVDFLRNTPSGPEMGIVETLGAISDQIGQFFERERQHRGLIRLSRLYAVLSGINAAIVRIHDREELFHEVCRIAVEEGEFGMAWVGEIREAAEEVVPVAWAGIQEEIATPSASLKAGVPGRESTFGEAIRSMRPVVINDLSTAAAAGERMEEALSRGYRSFAALPLQVDRQPAGIIALYASEADFFTSEELGLLTELANDISFALAYIDKQEFLAYLAYYDSLTGLPNRAQFQEKLASAMVAARRNPQEKVSVVLCNVNRFRNINDTYGRQVGDQLLRELAQRFKSLWPDPGNLARLAVDHFVGFIVDRRAPTEAVHALETAIKTELSQPVVIDGYEIHVPISAGFSVFPGDGDDAETLIRNAEAALRRTKTLGGPNLFYRPEMNALVAQSVRLENRLRQAVENEQFTLYYQPKVSGANREITGLEALIRWKEPGKGLVPPSDFIPMLEETGLIRQVGYWVIQRAIADSKRWRAKGIEPPRIAVNVSAVQLQQDDFVESISQAIRASGNGEPGIDIELTESMLMTDIENNVDRLNAIQRMGIGIAIDDFGTGYSSLGYLAKLPVNALKIDRSFIEAMMKSPESTAIVTAIVSMAHSLKLSVIAEGVEAEDQAEFLKGLDCNELQGFLISEPLPAELLFDYLRHNVSALSS